MIDLLEWTRAKCPSASRDLAPWDRDHLVNHYVRLQFQTGSGSGRHRDTKKRRVFQMARNQAH